MIRSILMGILMIAISAVSVFASSPADREMVEKMSMYYIEGFYEGSQEKLKTCLKPNFQKFGYWKQKDSTEYKSAGQFTWEKAMKYAADVQAKKNFAKPDSPKKVEFIDGTDKIAITKVYANWGIDYLMLAKHDGKWQIEQILWEGPVRTSAATDADRKGVERVGLNYVEGFYEGDESKLKAALDPKFYKFGYGMNKERTEYRAGSVFTYEQAMKFAQNVREKKNYPKPGTIKKVEVLDVMNKIGAVKVTAWWGIDYILASKRDNGWMAEQIIWASLRKK